MLRFTTQLASPVESTILGPWACSRFWRF